jgi:chorismate mutase
MTQQEIKDKIADWKTRLKNPSVASVASAVTKINSEIAKYEAMLEDENPAKVKAPKTEKKEKVAKSEGIIPKYKIGAFVKVIYGEENGKSGLITKVYSHKLYPKSVKVDDIPYYEIEGISKDISESNLELSKESKKDIKGSPEVLLYRTPKKSDLYVGLEVAYKDVYGEFTKTGKIDSINKNLYTIRNAAYTSDELRLLKGSKAEEKPTQKESKKDPYDCDDLIKEAKERRAKAKAAAEARAEAPKKTEATKDKEKIEKVHEAVEKQVEAGKLTKKQIVTLINETKDLLKLLEKALKNL